MLLPFAVVMPNCPHGFKDCFMRRIDVLINALSELTGRDKEAVAQTFEAIIAANPDKSKDMLAELSYNEASALYEKLIKDGPDVLARLVSRVSD